MLVELLMCAGQASLREQEGEIKNHAEEKARHFMRDEVSEDNTTKEKSLLPKVDDVLRCHSSWLSDLSICSMHAPSQTDPTFSHFFLPLAVDRTRRQLSPSLPPFLI